MIQVTIYENGFTVEGHASYSEHGTDIVCAAVSALAQSVAFTFMNYVAHCRLRSESGDLELYIKERGMNESEIDIRCYMNVLRTGIEQIELIYPDHVKLRYGERLMK